MRYSTPLATYRSPEEVGVITSVDAVTVYVSDQDRALEFHIELLGFEKRTDMQFGSGTRRVEVSPPGSSTRIALAQDYGGAWGAGRVGTFTGIVLSSRNIQATYDALHARGVRSTEPPSKQEWGFQAQFVDPDENSYVLVQRLL
jgi:predicted enzyme related to lactoylglutathione lyase